jgi:Calcium/calmodulin dependent protein kinase II Association.
MLTRFKFLLLCVLPLLIAPVASAQDREADHNELRAMLRTATDAMNTSNFDALRPLFYNPVSITTVDQKLFTSFDDFKAYYEGLLKGGGAQLKSITFKPEADALTEFVGDNIGLSHGTSTDTYTFADGDVRTMTSRWTATVYKDNGKWKILNLHIGTNLLDNPVTATLKGYVKKAALVGGVGGLIIGFIIAWLLRRRRQVA